MKPIEIYYGKNGTDRVSPEYLHINNCGFCSYPPDGVIKMTYREFGRKDYHFLYLLRGEVEAEYRGKLCRMKPGDCILYLPGERQRYSFSSECDTLTLWIHFSGTAAKEILAQTGLEGGIFHAGSPAAVETTGSRLVREFSLNHDSTGARLVRNLSPDQNESNELAAQAALTQNGLLLNLLSAFMRVRTPAENESPALEAVEYINRCYAGNESMDELAALCKLSTSRFLHCFKTLTGVSPNQYRISVRMARAKELLTDPALTVAEAAHAVGFPDPLYFSRCFRRFYGVSPQQFRKTDAGGGS